MNEFNLAVFLSDIVKKRRLILLSILAAAASAVIYTYGFAKNIYKSTITFLPPSSDGISISALAGGILPKMGGGESFSAETVPGIFESNAFKKLIIDKFNLTKRYKADKSKNKFVNTVKVLDKNLTISTVEQGSLGMTKILSFTIQADDVNPDTAYAMCQYAYSILDSIVIEITRSSAKRNADYIESQLSLKKKILDSLSTEYLLFQKKNSMYDLPSQIELSITQYGAVEAQKTLNDIELKFLKKDLDPSHPEVIALERKSKILQDELNKQLKNGSENGLTLSMPKSASLMPKYLTYKRELEGLNKLILYLTQSYEESRITENKSISKLAVVDPAFVPEYKYKPRRLILMASIFLLFEIIVFSGIVFGTFYREIIKKSEIYASVSKALKG